MIQTPIGVFRILQGKTEFQYQEKEILRKFGRYRSFEVDKRYQIEFDQIEKKTEVEFIFDFWVPIEIVNSGSDERLFYVMYRCENLIIGLGVEGDIPGIKYVYVDTKNKHGIKIIISSACKRNSMKINVPWKIITNSDQIINVELGLDPGTLS